MFNDIFGKYRFHPQITKCQPKKEERKKNNPQNSGHFVLLQRPRAAQALHLDQLFPFAKVQPLPAHEEWLECSFILLGFYRMFITIFLFIHISVDFIMLISKCFISICLMFSHQLVGIVQVEKHAEHVNGVHAQHHHQECALHLHQPKVSLMTLQFVTFLYIAAHILSVGSSKRFI